MASITTDILFLPPQKFLGVYTQQKYQNKSYFDKRYLD